MRIFVDAPFAAGAKLPLGRAQAHYLANVMRFKPGDTLIIFNGRDGEWRAAIAEMHRDTCTTVAEAETQRQQAVTGPVLLFAPLKPARSAMLIEKGCELGVSEFWPTFTQHSQSRRIKLDRYRAHAVEAAEQCGRMDVPLVRPLASLETLFASSAVGVSACGGHVVFRLGRLGGVYRLVGKVVAPLFVRHLDQLPG